VADGAFATIDYGGGLFATVTADGVRAVQSATIALHGSQRTAVASGENLIDLKTFVVDADETSELELVPQPHDNLRAVHANMPPFVTLLDAFAAAIDGTPAELPTFEDGTHTQRVLEAIGYTV
jgi:predicted dehydrogenase